MKSGLNTNWFCKNQTKSSITNESFEKFINQANKQYLKQDTFRTNNFKLILGIVLLLLLLVFIVMLSASYILDDENSKPGAYAGLSQEEKIELLNQRVKEGMVDVSIASNIVFHEGSSGPGKARFVNPETNHLSQKFILRIKGEEEVLYESGLVQPGYWIEEIYLNSYLDPGEYDVVVTIVTFDQNNNVVGQIDSEVGMTIF